MDSQKPSNAEVILRSAVAEALRDPSPASVGSETISTPVTRTGPLPPARASQPSEILSRQPSQPKETHVPVPHMPGQPGHVLSGRPVPPPGGLPPMQLHPPQVQSPQLPPQPQQPAPPVHAPYQPPRPPPPVAYQAHPPPPPQARQAPPPPDVTLPLQDAPFPSPGPNHARLGPRFTDDYYHAERTMRQILPESLRRALRVNWAKCLLGSEFHEAFVLNAVMRHMSPVAAKKSFRDFGRKLIDSAKDELVEHLTTADIDQLASAILAKASDRFLDAALERRLRTIEAKPLINALARAERLGYELDDIVEETPANGQERVIPQHQAQEPRMLPMSQASQASQVSQPGPAPPAPVAPPVASQMAAPLPQGQPRWQCHLCSRLFEFEDPFLHHMTKKICQVRPKPNSVFKCMCEFCGKGFSTTLGKQYHEMNNVCGDISTMRAQMQKRPMVTTDNRPTQPPSGHFAHPPASTPAQGSRHFEVYLPSSQASQPSSSRHAEYSSPASMAKIRAADAYAHLTEEQKTALEEEMIKVEEAYAERMREAESIADPNERRIKLDNLKNSFGTRQSGVRKKYGVRLRERRTRAEMDAERNRMMGSSGNKSATGTPQPREHSNDAKRPRLEQSEGAASRRSDSAFDSDDMTDRTRKTPAAKMSGGAATSGVADASVAVQKAATAAALHSSQAYPVELSSSSDDEEDIPARLPAVVRQSLD